MNCTFEKPAHAVPFGKRPPAPRKAKGKADRPFVGARGGGSNDGGLYDKPARAVPLASARQRPESPMANCPCVSLRRAKAARDPQLAAAARVAEETVKSSGLNGTLLALLAYSDCSVIALSRTEWRDLRRWLCGLVTRMSAQLFGLLLLLKRCHRVARSGRGCLWCCASCDVSELMSHCGLATCRW